MKQRDRLEDLGVDVDNIKMDQKEVGWDGVHWVFLTQDNDK
jgi:hypothetical protein